MLAIFAVLLAASLVLTFNQLARYMRTGGYGNAAMTILLIFLVQAVVWFGVVVCSAH